MQTIDQMIATLPKDWEIRLYIQNSKNHPYVCTVHDKRHGFKALGQANSCVDATRIAVDKLKGTTP